LILQAPLQLIPKFFVSSDVQGDQETDELSLLFWIQSLCLSLEFLQFHAQRLTPEMCQRNANGERFG